jgi:glycosyltransferase involved in cell wall biosynthesis
MKENPWVSFCMSTYKRPELLQKQLSLLSQQTFANFEVVISDNDPDASAKAVVESMNDLRFKYFQNSENIGMIKSFNKSIQRAISDYIVMVTDDDPVDTNFLEVFCNLYKHYPTFSMYCGFKRTGKNDSEIEFISKDDYLIEVLDPDKTSNLLWSSAIMKREDAIRTGLIPDYGSPHLADHAFIAQVGSVDGGLVLNKMFSSLTSHESNFSKFNFDYYVKGCEGFYKSLSSSFKNHHHFKQYKKTIIKHLGKWFIANIFALKKYYTIRKNDKQILEKLNECASKIMSFPFMKRYRVKFYLKSLIFFMKRKLQLLSYKIV